MFLLAALSALAAPDSLDAPAAIPPAYATPTAYHLEAGDGFVGGGAVMLFPSGLPAGTVRGAVGVTDHLGVNAAALVSRFGAMAIVGVRYDVIDVPVFRLAPFVYGRTSNLTDNGVGAGLAIEGGGREVRYDLSLPVGISYYGLEDLLFLGTTGVRFDIGSSLSLRVAVEGSLAACVDFRWARPVFYLQVATAWSPQIGRAHV